MDELVDLANAGLLGNEFSKKETKMDELSSAIDVYEQWMLGATKPRTQVFSKKTFEESSKFNYNLKSKKIHKYLQWEKQNFGINLGWTDDGKNSTGDKVARWFFAREGNSKTPILYGEPVAIGYGIAPSFLRYAERTLGINLDWSEKPVFEWKLLGGKIGDPVHTQEWIAIFNQVSTKGGECLIHFKQPAGAHIGWPSSKSLGDITKETGIEIAKEYWDDAVKALLGS